MENSEEKVKGKMNPAEENHQLHPDPIIQTSDESGNSNKGIQPSENMLYVKKPMPAANVTLLPNQFMDTPRPSQAAPSIGDIIESMLRFKWMIIAIFILTSVPAVVAIWTQVVPKYRARAELRVRPIIPRLVFRTDDNGMIPLYTSYVNTQVSIIRNPIVLQRALEQPGVQQTKWYKNPSTSILQKLSGVPISHIERLRDDFSALPRRNTEIIDVSFIAERAKDAEIIVNTVLDQYIEYIEKMSDTTEVILDRQLADEKNTLESDILMREKRAAELIKLLGTATPQELISSKRAQLEETRARLSELQQSTASQELDIKQAVNDDSNSLSVAPIDKTKEQLKYSEDAEWRQLNINMKTIRHQIDNSIFTPNHPKMKQLENDLKFAEELLKRREAELDEQWLNRPKNNDEKFLIAELEKQQKEFEVFFENAQSLENENNTILYKRGLLNAVQQRLDEKNIERNVPASIMVLTRALAPSRPYNDRRKVFTAMALFLCLGMAGGVAFLRATMNQTIYNPKEMPQSMQVPFLGQILVTQNGESSNGKVCPAFIESIRVVRTALLSRLEGQNSTSILVTSALQGTGKSTFTMMLGKSLAQAGKKILIIDADFNKMTLTKKSNLSDKSGFIQSLRCRSVNEQHIFPTDTSGLSIVPAGKRDNISEVFEEIANGDFKAFIGKLRKQYNIILLDSSPLLAMADATIFSSQVDGVIMVEREFVSHRADLINALARLSSVGGRLLGTVFIGSDSHGKYGYSQYYSRTSEPSHDNEPKKSI